MARIEKKIDSRIPADLTNTIWLGEIYDNNKKHRVRILFHETGNSDLVYFKNDDSLNGGYYRIKFCWRQENLRVKLTSPESPDKECIGTIEIGDFSLNSEFTLDSRIFFKYRDYSLRKELQFVVSFRDLFVFDWDDDETE